MDKKKYALVTGGAKGLGWEYTKLLLLQNHHVIIVSRDAKIDPVWCNKFPQQSILCWNYDLTKQADLAKLVARLQDYEIEICINNAGIGYFSTFGKKTWIEQIRQIELNVQSLLHLSWAVLQQKNEQQPVHIINIASVAGFFAGPYGAVYYASKAAVILFSETLALEEEERLTLNKVSVICPPSLKTGFWANNEHELKAAYRLDKFAYQSLFKAYHSNKVVITVGVFSKLLYFFRHLIPVRIIKQTMKIYR